jgi:hypothetical protein
MKRIPATVNLSTPSKENVKMTNQTDTETTERTVTIAEEFFYALMKNAGRAIDPAAAEVHWIYARTLDPYNVHPDLPPEAQQLGREYYACNPGSDIWVWFNDLPQATYEALRHKALNARPAWFNTPLGEAWKRLRLDILNGSINMPVRRSNRP